MPSNRQKHNDFQYPKSSKKLDPKTITDTPSGCNSALAMQPTGNNSGLRPEHLPRSNFLFNSITVSGGPEGSQINKKRGKESARWDLSIQNFQTQSRVDSMISPADTR